MNGFALGLVFVAFKAFGGVYILVEGYGMNRGDGRDGQSGEHERGEGEADRGEDPRPAAHAAGGRVEPDALKELCQCASEEQVSHELWKTRRVFLNKRPLQNKV
jgi:hypothetical protein